MATESTGNRIDQSLAQAPPGLWPFLAAGYPSLDATAALLRALDGLPLRGVELGFPFSDPVADGPVIQHAFNRALAAGVSVRGVMEMVKSIRGAFRHPLIAMVSASIVYRIGPPAFVTMAREAGFDGLIVPDLSLEEAPELARLVAEANLRLSMLVAPTTPGERQERIAKLASGFLYYVSVQGTTGQRDRLPGELRTQVEGLRAATGLPVLVGFGISRPEQVRAVCGFADGAIVGSAIVQRITESIGAEMDEARVVEEAARFVGRLALG